MQELSNINVIKEILSANGFTFSKSLGQNFLINPTVCPRMAEACGADENTGVIEIGAGIGVLTAELAKRAKKVVSLELDTRLIPVLAKTLEDFDNVEVLNADVLKTDLDELIAARFAGMRVVVCANLPYYITSPVIMYLLESRIPIDAALCARREQRRRSGHCGCQLLRRREEALRCFGGLVHARAQGGQQRDKARYQTRAARQDNGRKILFPRGQGGVRSAQKDCVELAQRGAGYS